MAGNQNLNSAAKAKNDEFYTQFEDINKELNCYLEYDKNVFRDKTILLPCDDPQFSNFTNFFAQKFHEYGLKKLISTSYAVNSKKFKMPVQLNLFERNSPQYNPSIDDLRGRLYTLDCESIKSNSYPPEALQWVYLDGDGDFRSDEVKKLFAEADVIITNPPFSLFREFLKQILAFDKKFLIIGNINCITYKEVFPLIKENKIWLGRGFKGSVGFFYSPYEDYAVSSQHKENMIRISGINWLTNLEHGRRHKPMILNTMAENIKHNKHKQNRDVLYKKYDNYDAIEVPYTNLIPRDYEGVMGVPITFLDKYNPEQFEILGLIADKRNDNPAFIKGTPTFLDENHKNYVGAVLNGKATYARVLIRRR